MKMFLIQHFLNYEFAYIFLLFFLIFAILIFFIKIKSFRMFFFILLAIFFVLGIYEIILSFYMPYPTTKVDSEYLNKIEIDDILLKRKHKMIFDKILQCRIYNEDIDTLIDKNDRVRYKTVFDVIEFMYNNRFRYTAGNSDSKQTYIFFGCSFAFGSGLNNEDTLPYYFSKLMGFKNNVINAGVPGKGTNAILNILNNASFQPFIKHDSKIIHCFYLLIGDHIWRNFRIESDCLDNLLVVNNKMEHVKQPFGIFKIIFARSYVFKKLFLPIIEKHNKHFYENYLIKSLETINQIICKKYNSELTVIIWSGLNQEFINRLKKCRLDIIFLPDYLNSEEEGYIIPYDGHPSAQANEKIANMLYEHIESQQKKLKLNGKI